jgi:hypothetical protein
MISDRNVQMRRVWVRDHGLRVGYGRADAGGRGRTRADAGGRADGWVLDAGVPRTGEPAGAHSIGNGYLVKYQFSGLMLRVGLCGRAPLRLFATSVRV